MTAAEVAAHHVNGGAIMFAKKPAVGKILEITRDSVRLRVRFKHLFRQAHRSGPFGCGAVRTGVEPTAGLGRAAGSRAPELGRVLQRRDGPVPGSPESHVRNVPEGTKVVPKVREADHGRHGRQVRRRAGVARELVHEHAAVRAARGVDPVQVNAVLREKVFEDSQRLRDGILARRPPAVVRARAVAIYVAVHVVRVEVARPVVFLVRPADGGQICRAVREVGAARAAVVAAEAVPRVAVAVLAPDAGQ